MNPVAYLNGDTVIYWSGLIIALGIAAGFLLSYAIWTAHTNKGAALWVFLPFAIVLSVLFCRLLHFYCHDEQYLSFGDALVNYSSGGFALAGSLLGVFLAALIVKAFKLVRSSAALLDVIAPGFALSIAFIRLSAFFGTSGRSKFAVSTPLFRHLPFSVAMVDSAGNVEYRVASFFIEFLLFMAVAILLVLMYYNCRGRSMLPPEKKNGHVARIFLVLYSIIEIVIDSTRYDSLTIHFRTSLLQKLNKFASFIKLAQVIGAIVLICVLVHYVKMSVKCNGKKWYQFAAVGAFIAATAAAGYFGEYWVQRAPDTAQLRYAIMSLCMIADAVIIYLMYRTCIQKEIEIDAEDD